MHPDDVRLFTCCSTARHLRCLAVCKRELGDCEVCTDVMNMENSIEVPCCGQFVHVTCLARSFSPSGVDRTFCNQSLAEFARSVAFLTASHFHGRFGPFAVYFPLHHIVWLFCVVCRWSLRSSRSRMTIECSGHQQDAKVILSGSVSCVRDQWGPLASLNAQFLRVLSVEILVTLWCWMKCSRCNQRGVFLLFCPSSNMNFVCRTPVPVSQRV